MAANEKGHEQKEADLRRNCLPWPTGVFRPSTFLSFPFFCLVGTARDADWTWVGYQRRF